eukprot:1345775-Pleurochrysis_carterae.AAC.1
MLIMRMEKASSLQASMHSFLVSSGYLLVVELFDMQLTSYSRMELVVEEKGVQLVLVKVQNILEVAIELEELGPALIGELLCDSIFGVVGHYDVDLSSGGPQPRRPKTVWGWSRCTQTCHLGCVAALYANNTAVQITSSAPENADPLVVLLPIGRKLLGYVREG